MKSYERSCLEHTHWKRYARDFSWRPFEDIDEELLRERFGLDPPFLAIFTNDQVLDGFPSRDINEAAFF